jgi:outer membrane lipoprotein SlyB
MNRTTKIFAAAGVALTLALPASQAFAASNQTKNAVIGGALGALAGALIGKGSTTAIVAGAAGGALVGSAATSDRQRYEDAQRRAYRARYDQRYVYNNGYGQPVYNNGYRWNDRRYDDRRYRQTNYGYGY